MEIRETCLLYFTMSITKRSCCLFFLILGLSTISSQDQDESMENFEDDSFDTIQTEYRILQNVEIPSGYVDGKLCNRDCKSPKLKCFFYFKLEQYSSMSRECVDCPNTLSDCWRPGCIVGGGLKRNVTVVNRQLPGPSIEVCKGDRIMVFIENRLPDERGTTIHWHGPHMSKYKYMDGVPWVTQCPIRRNDNFTYEFRADDVGTFWWHSHVAEMQRGDGVFGPLIIRQHLSKDYHSNIYDFDLSSHVITVTDWNDRMREDVFTDYANPYLRFGPTGILVNGLGYQSTTNLTSTPPATFSVVRGYRYRFRLINVGFYDCPIEISIDGHRMLIIATDGEDLKPFEVDSFVSSTGERFDFILNAEQPIGKYYIRVKGLNTCGMHHVFTVAILQYEGDKDFHSEEEFPTYLTAAPTGGVIFNPITRNNANKYSYSIGINQPTSTKSLELILKTKKVQTFYITLAMNVLDNPNHDFTEKYPNIKARTPQLNGITNKMCDEPLLPNRFKTNSSTFCNEETMKDQDCDNNFCSCPHIIEVEKNSVVEFVFIETARLAFHPMHLHGYSFRVLGWQEIDGEFTKADIIQMDQLGLIKRNFVNPPLKDTVTVPKGGYTIVRFRASNVGYWLMHCRIGVHAFAGMELILKVGKDSAMPPVPKNYPQCADMVK